MSLMELLTLLAVILSLLSLLVDVVMDKAHQKQHDDNKKD